MPYWRSIGYISAGILVGLVALLSLRVVYYGIMGYEPNMHPGVVFYALPLLELILCFLACLLEPLLRRFIWHPRTRIQAALVGLSYPAGLSWWAFADHWYVVLVLNPLVLRLVCRAMDTRLIARAQRASP